ncbi:MAG: efflux RND transporter permease subunit [Gloeomargarita sp. HHBFW_bins_162]
MNWIETAVRWRHGTFVLFCLLAVFGVISLLSLPLELQPGGDRPEITITTQYPGAAPAEVEDLVTRPLEEVLEQVPGVQRVKSASRAGTSSISLEFAWGTDVNLRLVEVLNKLQQADNLPAEAGTSDVEVVGGNSAPMIWLVMTPQEGYPSDPNRYRDLLDDVVVPRLRRVDGVGQFLVVGGREREVEVIVNPQALAERNLRLEDVVTGLRTNNRDVRGGPLNLGRREYRVRTVSRSQEVSQLEGFVLRRDAQGTVYLRDVGRAQMGRKLRTSTLYFNDQQAAAVGIIRRVGANVPEVSRGVRQTVRELAQEFQRQNQGVRFVYNYDESEYINQSVRLVEMNLITGAVLATVVLILFLGSLRTVAVIALTIPTTLITVFIVMAVLGRSLNIISLAGLAFAVGMVVDNAIVVIENIFTHLQQGKSVLRAAIDGTQEVWGAMLGSTLTTVVVFIPLLLVTGESGRLFADIGIALTSAVLVSLLAALTLVPMLSGLFLDAQEAQRLNHPNLVPFGRRWERWVWLASVRFRAVQERLEGFLLTTAAWSLGAGKIGRRLLVLAVPLSLIFVSILLLPPVDYLPEGNRNLVLWAVEPFPGTSIDEAVQLSEGPRGFLRQQPEVERVMFIERPGRRAIAAILKPEFATARGLQDMVERLRRASNQFPGYRFMNPIRLSIFRDPGKEFEVQIIGPDLTQLDQLSQQVLGELRGVPGVRSVRSNYLFGAPELQVMPLRERLREVGLTEADVGGLVEAALGGRKASDFVDGKRQLDVTVKLDHVLVETPAQLRALPLFGQNGKRVQLADVAEVVETTGPDVINHVDLERAVTLTASVADDAPLGRVVRQAEKQVLEPLRSALPAGYRVELSGTADRLRETVSQLVQAFVLSLFITYLLLVALYRSFIYPLVIMATVPLGMSGALLALAVSNVIPGLNVPLDMITALGFVILTGVVVNNAILLVDRALQLQNDGKDYTESLYLATKDRLRAIFMAAGTSVLGMLPLALIPGQGAELYQGLGIALVGGLAFSTVLTPTIVPALMALLQDVRSRTRDTGIGAAVSPSGSQGRSLR